MPRGHGGYYPSPRSAGRGGGGGRGRGRGRQPIVEDLREKLDRMRLEKEKIPNEGPKNPPPPDPTYNFLKDPLRGDNYAQASSEKRIGNKNQRNKFENKIENNKEYDHEQKNSSEVDKIRQKQCSVRFVEDVETKSTPPRRGGPRPNWRTPYHVQKKASNFNENNVITPKHRSVPNITVEFFSESGERKCAFDESKTVEVPIVPKKNYTVRPKSGRWPYRGPQRYYGGRYNKQYNNPRSTFPPTEAGIRNNVQGTRKQKHFNRNNERNETSVRSENWDESEENDETNSPVIIPENVNNKEREITKNKEQQLTNKEKQIEKQSNTESEKTTPETKD